MPWHPRKPDNWYAIRIRNGAKGTVYRVSFTRHGQTVAALFRAADHGGERAALKAARDWRDRAILALPPETKQSFSQRLRPDNTSGHPGVYLKRQRVKRGGFSGDYLFWQAQTPQGVTPFRSRSFSVARYGYDKALRLVIKARAEFVRDLAGHVGVAPIPKRFRPAD